MIYVLVGGGALNAVFIPQLVRAMKNDDDGGEAYANRLLTLVVVLLGAVTTICVLAAPLFIGMMSQKIADDPQRLDVAVAFAHYCLPTMFFMGIHVVLGQILNARGRFGAMMWTPVLNNIIVIATFGAFIWAFGGFTTTGVSEQTITPEGVRLLGIGTLLGLVVQSLAMLPYLRDAGFKMRLRFDWKGHGLGKAAGLAKWTFFFVLANQVGLVVVTQLATWAGEVADKQGHGGTGITGYNYALLLWQMPQAIITVSVMTAVLPRISRSAHDGDAAAVRDDISYGLRTSAVAIVPCAFAFLALGVPMATLLYASTGADDATNIGYILMAFGLGLIPYSVQYVVLRGFYAYEDTRTPFYNTVIVAAVNAGCLRARLLRPPRALGRRRHGRRLRPRLRRRCRRGLAAPEEASGRRSRRRPRDAYVHPADRRLRTGRSRRGRRRLRHHPLAGQQRRRLPRRPRRWRHRARCGLPRRREADEDRRAQRDGRNGPRTPGSLMRTPADGTDPDRVSCGGPDCGHNWHGFADWPTARNGWGGRDDGGGT